MRLAGRRHGRWMVLGRWASSDKHVRRTSVPGQSDALGHVDVDTWKAASSATRLPAPGAADAPRRRVVGVAVGVVPGRGGLPAPASVPAVSAPGAARGVVLDVPRYSQMVHRGEFSQYGGGGEAWCSPTSTAMVLGYYGRLPAAVVVRVGRDRGPTRGSTRWRVAPTTPPTRGTGNWPFNTAYAASRGLSAFVTRLRSLAEAESLDRRRHPGHRLGVVLVRRR